MTAIRTCIGCGNRDGRGHLVRVVLADGRLAIDRTRCAPGRGAYLHQTPACWEAFVRRRGPIRSLRSSIAREERMRLATELAAPGMGA